MSPDEQPHPLLKMSLVELWELFPIILSPFNPLWGECMNETPTRISLNKGYTLQGFAEKVFHLHLRYGGDNDELYFRDYVQEHLLVARQYEALKISLWKPYKHDRDAYTAHKTDFIKKYTQIAKKMYQRRYA